LITSLIDRFNREKNKEHAKKSRVRKKFLVDSLQSSLIALEQENEKLRSIIRDNFKEEAPTLLAECANGGSKLQSNNNSGSSSTKQEPIPLDKSDYSLLKSLQMTQHSFILSDPSLPDNPITYASQGFLDLTGYSLSEVLNKNCRFLQGEGTDKKTIEFLHEQCSPNSNSSDPLVNPSNHTGEGAAATDNNNEKNDSKENDDIHVVVLNYKKDGTPFWNQLFIAPLRDFHGKVVNYLGVQCEVSEETALTAMKSHKHNQYSNKMSGNNRNNKGKGENGNNEKKDAKSK
jgi:PAS domain-containing protein